MGGKERAALRNHHHHHYNKPFQDFASQQRPTHLCKQLTIQRILQNE